VQLRKNRNASATEKARYRQCSRQHGNTSVNLAREEGKGLGVNATSIGIPLRATSAQEERVLRPFEHVKISLVAGP
jgi:hypothetical protein